MNTSDVLKYGHLQFLNYVNSIPVEILDKPGACGIWSTKDIVAHILSFELLLSEILNQIKVNDIASNSTPFLKKYTDQTYNFNDIEVTQNKVKDFKELLDEYTKLAEENTEIAKKLSKEKLSTPGTLPWYGAEYSIDDYIIYAVYGHKREHGAQIDKFLDEQK
jgi:hypothetical protein